MSDDLDHGFSGAAPLRGEVDVVRACEICCLSGATHVMPNGRYIHLRCGMNEWQKQLAQAKRKGKA